MYAVVTRLSRLCFFASGSKVPAPNAHRIETGQTETGIYTGNEFTFKGRQSPYVYSGIQGP